MKDRIELKKYYSTKEFLENYIYEENNLGVECTEEGTTFRLWSPQAECISLNLYQTGDGGNAYKQIPMKKEEKGVWSWESKEELHGVYYDYLITRNDEEVRSADPYAKACGVNGLRSMAVNLKKTNPKGWEKDQAPEEGPERIVYELHVKEFSWDKAGGFPEEYRGKYKAFTCRHTTLNGDGIHPTGLDYLKELGVTHIQIMPMYDYGSVNEAGEDTEFNWGYDPVNYNVPEGSYATDARHGEVRIREMKEMIQAIHEAGFGVIMDVVYNHTYSLDSWFQRTAPWYFYRVFPDGTVSDGSACGNDVASVREEQETSKFQKASENIYRTFVKAERNVIFNAPLMMTTVYTCIILISWLGAKMIVSSTLTTGELMSLLAYCTNILMSLMMLSMVFVMISMSTASMQRISEVLNEESDLHNPADPVFEVKDGRIEFKNVEFAYKKDSKEPVLTDINLKIRSGETIGIIGGTGSAKTSLVNLVSRLYDVTKGEVLVGGRNVREYDMESLRNQVAVVLQKNVLFSGTILENLRWGNKNATDEECIEACKLACADEFIERFPKKYETYIEQAGNNVSGGQKQRLCIARAILKKPKILILDDSTSAVDTATDAKIRRAFREEIPDTTKLIIAQRVSSVQDADRIIVMDEGRINGFGTHEELLDTNGIYREVYESQTQGGGDFDEKAGE